MILACKKNLANRQKKWVWVRPPPPVWKKFPHKVVFFLRTSLAYLARQSGGAGWCSTFWASYFTCFGTQNGQKQILRIGQPPHFGKKSQKMSFFLASQDALGVMLFTDWLTDWWLAMTWLMWPWWMMIPKEDLTGVILLSEDGFWRLDWCDSGYWGGFLETWLMWFWLLRRPFRDLTDVTLVSDDILRLTYWLTGR